MNLLSWRPHDALGGGQVHRSCRGRHGLVQRHVFHDRLLDLRVELIAEVDPNDEVLQRAAAAPPPPGAPSDGAWPTFHRLLAGWQVLGAPRVRLDFAPYAQLRMHRAALT